MTELDIAGIGMTSQRTRDRLIRRLEQEGIEDRRVLNVMRTAPRHLFVEEAMASHAYDDTALPIGHGQTISQPYVVARMTEALLEIPDTEKVLEVGTGSGYQAYILSQLYGHVFTVERIQGLYRRTHQLMRDLRVRNITMRYSDGSWGLPEHGPYKAIMVTAAPEQVPEALLEQLDLGGRMVIPVGAGETQELMIIDRTEAGFERRVIERVRFVPLLGGAG